MAGGQMPVSVIRPSINSRLTISKAGLRIVREGGASGQTSEGARSSISESRAAGYKNMKAGWLAKLCGEITWLPKRTRVADGQQRLSPSGVGQPRKGSGRVDHFRLSAVTARLRAEIAAGLRKEHWVQLIRWHVPATLDPSD